MDRNRGLIRDRPGPAARQVLRRTGLPGARGHGPRGLELGLMLDVVTIEVRGVPEAIARLDAAEEAIRGALTEAITQETLLVEAEVKDRTPRVTGQLQSSIGHITEVGPLGPVGR